MRVLKQDYARERTHRRLMRLYSLLGDRAARFASSSYVHSPSGPSWMWRRPSTRTGFSS